MKDVIYVRLLNEGTVAYRPVVAVALGENIYELKGDDIYDPDDETWEFTPGTTVITKKQILNGDSVFVAVGKYK